MLADGLDEVADEGLRARLCGYLWEQVEGTRVRAVVSSRYAGYRRAVRLPAQFTELELRPLSGEMVDRLVRQWFAEAVRVVRTVSEEEAQARGRELIAALHSDVYTTQRLKVMVSTPLLLTLLCVIVHQGRPMPRSRAEYYERCLEVLLLRWGKEQKRREPPLVIDKALAVLRPLAYALQASGDRDTRLRAELAVMVKKRLRELGLDDRLGMQVVDWLQRDAGVLQEFAPEHLGFAHLGLQEYLAATHIGERDTLLDELTAHLADPWWHEVARLVAGQRVAFVPLMRRVLKVQISQGELLDQLLDEAPEADATPLLERLHAGGTPRELATVLRLLRRFSGDERVREAVAERSGDKDAEMQALAAQILEVRESGGMREGAEVVLVFFEKERTAAEGLAKELRACGVQVFSDAQGRLFDALELNSELAAAEAAPCVVVLSGREGPAWHDTAVSSCVAYFVDARKAMAWALLPGGVDAAWPAELGEARRFDVRDPGGCDALRGWLATARRGARRIESGQHFIEQVTGIRFLWVPGGRFEMGMKGVEEPVHWVRLSPYWLAETPVTNAQYGKFLAATGREEPWYWRDRGFSHEEQPVVGVSWEDAMQFCTWLSEQPEVIASGVKVTLPSEAQWEFAARGTDGRRYPWGDEPADATRAVYGRKDGTAKLGSCPAGKGPFGHLDLAGNVWQWCRDGFKPDEYRRSGRQESVDPVGQSGDDLRVVRGDSWRFDEVRPAARRRWLRSVSRLDDLGFQVVSEPASR
ncbi:MAG: SUMF1/EgtB/PvdO family nonheme iron enzyme [Nannocystis sp.]|nr:SUMF1/EgtB/PvdO family nonheme iron enzyme [Nannocystis sp.]